VQDFNLSFEMMRARRGDSLRSFDTADRSGLVRARSDDAAARRPSRWLFDRRRPTPTPAPPALPGVVQQQQ
jgi:hypothetical protein